VQLEDRRVRLPPLAKLQVEEAQGWLDQALAAGRRAMMKLETHPAGAALDLAQQIDLTHQGIRRLDRACSGVPGVVEKQTVSATNADRSMTNI
jgi:hypothetical protein